MALPIEQLTDANQSALQSAISSFRGMFAGPTNASADLSRSASSQQVGGLSAEAQTLFDLKRDIIAQVRADLPEGERPTLEQYRLACDAFAQTEKGQAMADRNEWNARVYADLSGQDLSGFTIREPKKSEGQHHLDITDPALEPAPEETHGHHIVRANYDAHDRDGDGGITIDAAHPFYDNVRFDKADLHGAFVEPATSFNEEIAKAGNLKDLTFSGMSEGDVFTFRPGVYENAHMTNINDGEIIFADSSQVKGITIEGTKAKITIGDHASVDHIEVSDHFRIISLEMGKNSVISNSDLGQSTVSMTSHFEPGATFQNVNLSGNLSGLDFTGLKLNNVTIDNTAITHASQLADYGITHDRTTLVTSHAQASTDTPMSEIDRIRATLQASQESIGKPLNEQETAALQATQAAREARQQHEQAQSFLPPLPGRKG